MKKQTASCLLATTIALIMAGSASADGPSSHPRKVARTSDARPAHSINDVALQSGDVLRGRFVDENGTPIDGAKIVIRQEDRIAAVRITDDRGEFAAEGLGSGVYRIESPTAGTEFRFWGSEDAPPSARSVALIVSQNPTLRGQYRYRNLDLLTLGLGAGGVTLGVLALDKADDAEARADRMEAELTALTPVSP